MGFRDEHSNSGGVVMHGHSGTEISDRTATDLCERLICTNNSAMHEHRAAPVPFRSDMQCLAEQNQFESYDDVSHFRGLPRSWRVFCHGTSLPAPEGMVDNPSSQRT